MLALRSSVQREDSTDSELAGYVRQRLAQHLAFGGERPTPRVVVRALLAPPLPPREYVDAVVGTLIPDTER